MYDIRELQGVEDEAGSMVSSLEREKGVLVDDLRWQGQRYSASGGGIWRQHIREALSAKCVLMVVPPLFTSLPTIHDLTPSVCQ